MSSALVAALAFSACWLLFAGGSRSRLLPLMRKAAAPRAGTEERRVEPGSSPRRLPPPRLFGRREAADFHEMPLLVHQLTALLRAGRSPQQLWQDALEAYRPRDETEQTAAGTGREFAERIIPVLKAARRAADLGYSVAGAIRAAQGQTAGAGEEAKQLRRMWLDVALCWEVAEQSGAPLADLLARYALQLEAGLDAQAARDTALAGPQATVRLLTWLPVFGLGLGILMGVDPLTVLFGTPVGWAALAAGVVLMLAGRWWSSKMVASAAGRD